MKNALGPERCGPSSAALASFDVGMWRVIHERHPAKLAASWVDDLAKWKNAIQDQYLVRLLTDIYQLGPGLFVFCVASRLLRGVEEASTIYLSNRLIALVSRLIMLSLFF